MKKVRAYIYRVYPNNLQKKYFEECYIQNIFLFNEFIKNNITGKIFLKDFIKKYALFDEKYLNSFINTTNLYFKIKSKNISNIQPKNLNSYPRKIHFSNFGNELKFVKNHLILKNFDSLKIVLHRDIPKNGKIIEYILEERIPKKFYINLIIAYETKISKVTKIEKSVGLDYSSPYFYISSDNEVGNNIFGDFDEIYERIGFLQNRLSKCIVGSKNYNKIRAKILGKHQFIVNKRRDFLHKKSLTLVINYDLIGVETLDLIEMSKVHHLGKSVYRNSFNTFCNYLNYKAADYGKYLIYIPKFFPSTKMCSNCGKINNLALNERTYVCRCGNKMNRDLNAAINIKKEAKIILNKKPKNIGG